MNRAQWGRDIAVAQRAAATFDRWHPAPIIQIAAIHREATRRREDPDGDPLVPVARSLRSLTFSSWELDEPRAARAASVVPQRVGSRYGTPPGGVPVPGVDFQAGPGGEHGELPGLCWHGLREGKCGACAAPAAARRVA